MSKKSEAEIPKSKNGLNLASLLQGLKEEFEKVVWPNRRQLVSESAGVLLMVTLSSSVIFLVDQFLTWAVKQVF